MLSISRKIGMFSFVVVLLLAFVLSLSAHEAAKKSIVCPECSHINDWANDFCINCCALIMKAKSEAEKRANEVESAKVLKAEMRMKEEKAMKANPQEERQDEPVEKIPEGPIDPRRLFVIPVADVLGSMEVNIGGGTAFGVRKTERPPFLGHIRIGLGGVGEVEVSTIAIINRLAEGSASIPTAAFKVKLISEGKLLPSVAGALRSSLWHTEERGMYKFQKRLSTLYFVSSKTFGKASVHAGISISDLRIRTKTIDDEYFSPTPEWIDLNDKDYFNKNMIAPFIGARIELNPKTFLMLEIEQVAEYDFDEEIPVVSKGDISAEWMAIAGVRFFFLDWLALDTGVMYRSDYNGIGDAHIEAGLNISVSLPKVVRSLW